MGRKRSNQADKICLTQVKTVNSCERASMLPNINSRVYVSVDWPTYAKFLHIKTRTFVVVNKDSASIFFYPAAVCLYDR